MPPPSPSTDSGSSSPHVVVLIPAVEGTGGTERSLLIGLPPLVERGARVDVVLFSTRTSRIDELEATGARVVDLGGGLSRAQVVRAVRRHLRDERVDILVTMLYDADILGRLAAWRTGTAVMGTFVNIASEQVHWRARLAGHLDGVTARHFVDHFHAVTEGVAASAVERLRVDRERITVVERGRDLAVLGEPSDARRTSVRSALGLPHDAEVVVAAGRHYPDKDHVTLLEAVERLQEDRPRVHLVIAGADGPSTGAIERARGGLRDPSRVHVLGHRDDVADVMVAGDVFVQSSLREGAAGAVIEAAALRLPIVRTDVAGLSGTFVDGVSARVVPVGDASAMAMAIVDLLDDRPRAQALGASARTEVEARHLAGPNGERFADLVIDVARHRVPGRWGVPSRRGTIDDTALRGRGPT